MNKWLIFVLALLYQTFSITLPIHNGIFSQSGEYTVTIQLGTPGKSFQVQVDTGSAKLAVPCTGCNGCHQSANPLFDPTESSTYSTIPCSNQTICDQCQIMAFGPNKCLLNQSYQDNSSIKGQIALQVFTIPGLSSPIQTEFGCIHQQNEIMSAIGVDGIWGVGRSADDQNGQLRRVDHLIKEISKQGGNSQRLLAICLAIEGGILNIGPVDNNLHTKPGVIFPYDDAFTDNIAKSIGKISVGSFLITQNGSLQLPQIMIDSGTTVSSLSTNVYNGIINAIDSYCSQIRDKCIQKQVNNKKCYILTDHQQVFRHIPPISIDFNGSSVLWHAQQYLLVEEQSQNQYCISFDKTNGEGSIFGDDFMLNKDIVFGQHYMVIYPQSKCGGQVVTYGYGSQRRLLTEGLVTQEQYSAYSLILILSILIVSVFTIYKMKAIVSKKQMKKVQINELCN